MKTFTLIINADNKNFFANQYKSYNLDKELLLKWAREVEYVPQNMRSFLVDEIVEWYEPAALDGVENVWRDLFLIKNNSLFLYVVNIIESDMSDTIFPLKDTSSFTFITYFCNHNRAHQFRVSTLEEGLMLWATSLNVLNKQQRKILLKYIQQSKRNPDVVESLKNVWTTSYKIFRSLLTLHIIKTV